MKRLASALLGLALALVPLARAEAIQCVAYAREISGVHLSGDAWQWWRNAAGTYQRGRVPHRGAVLVFARQGHMAHGHVSVVTRVISRRVVLVDHANWAPAHGAGRGKVARGVPVLDVSPRNDWTRVRVWFRPAAQFGIRVYHTRGFVYDGLHGGGLRDRNRYLSPSPLGVGALTLDLPVPVSRGPTCNIRNEG